MTWIKNMFIMFLVTLIVLKITDTVFEGASTPELTIQVYDRLIKELVRETD